MMCSRVGRRKHFSDQLYCTPLPDMASSILIKKKKNKNITKYLVL